MIPIVWVLKVMQGLYHQPYRLPHLHSVMKDPSKRPAQANLDHGRARMCRPEENHRQTH